MAELNFLRRMVGFFIIKFGVKISHPTVFIGYYLLVLLTKIGFSILFWAALFYWLALWRVKLRGGLQ
ncbi:hypothetical protein ACQ86O_21410 [Serratia sp. L9]|uniref:hypothetical protein n=1 Tax=Serratia sp. L9 TaxID=3423946 RepID=UPI003D67B0BA